MSELEEKSQDKNVSYIIIQKTYGTSTYQYFTDFIQFLLFFLKKPGACTYKYGIYMNFK